MLFTYIYIYCMINFVFETYAFECTQNMFST